MRTETREKSSWGIVHYGGTILGSGSGDWTVIKTGAGAYTIRIAAGTFKAQPRIRLTPYGNGVCTLGTINATDFVVNIYNPATGAQVDTSFQFEAIGKS